MTWHKTSILLEILVVTLICREEDDPHGSDSLGEKLKNLLSRRLPDHDVSTTRSYPAGYVGCDHMEHLPVMRYKQ